MGHLQSKKTKHLYECWVLVLRFPSAPADTVTIQTVTGLLLTLQKNVQT